MCLTERLVRLWWRRLNIAVFRGKLQEPQEIALIRHRREYGWAIPLEERKIRLTLHPTFASRRLFLGVLVHEMIHAWQHQQNKFMNHGAKFREWAPRIKWTINLDLFVEFSDAC